MSIPAGLSWNLVALHGAVSRDHILDDTGQYMADVRFAIGSWRAIIKHVGWMTFMIFDTLLEDIIIFPEFFHFFLTLHKL